MNGLDVYHLLCLAGGVALFVYGVVSGRRPRREPETPNSYPQGMMPMLFGATLFFLPMWGQVAF